MKIVINKCWGGFGLSKKAVMRLHKLGCKHVEEQTREQFFGNSTIDDTIEKQDKTLKMLQMPMKNDIILSDEHRSDNRSCPFLVKVVEEMGEKASGEHSNLKIIEIPDDIKYTLEDYDGMEHIAEKHRTWS